MKYIKQQILHDRKIGDRQLIITGDGNIELTPGSGTVTINGDLRVTGNATGPTNSLTYYVSLEGDDDNDGLGSGPDRAKRTVKAAVEAAPAGATIQLAPGDYYENNPITLKERQTVRGDSLRNVQIWPLNNTDDIFFVDNACYIFQVTFRGLRDPGWCVRIKPGALVTTSPYVQNCTNMNGPWLNDGTEFVPFQTVQIEGVAPSARPIINNPDVPLAKRVNETGGGNGMLVDGNEYDQRSLVFSMVADAFTQIAQGGIGFHITNFGYTQIVSCFSVFTRIGFLATKGGYLSISNSVSDFGTFAIIADGLFDEIYTTARPSQDYFSSVGSITVNSAGAGYVSAPVVVIDPPTTPGGVQATGQASIDPSTGQVTAVSVLNAGSGYDFLPTIQFVGGGFSVPATATVNLTTNQVIEVNSLRDQPQVGSIIQFEGDNTKYYVTETDVTTQPFIYDESVCRRDVRRIVDAVLGDMVMGTNYQAIAAGRSYLRSTSQVVLLQQLEPTIYGIEAARDEMLARIPDSDPANEDARYAIIEAFAIITDIISQGDSTARPDIDYNNLLTIDSGTIAAKNNILANKEFIIEEVTKYIAEQFTNLSYNQDKCERDTTLITIGTAYDVALGTNYNSVINGIAYARSSSSAVTERQKTQTVASLEYLKDRILDLSNVAADSTATTRATNSIDEIIEIVNGLDFDVATCRRDINYIIDSTAFDAALGTNYNAVTAGLSYQRAPSAYVLSAQFEQTKDAIRYLKTVAAEYLSSNSTAVSRSNAAFNEILDIIENGVGSADALTWTNIPTANKNYARALLQANRTFISTELTDWIDAQIAANTGNPSSPWYNFTYNSATCARDTRYIVDAISFDVQYSGNFATRRAADAYFTSAVSVLPESQKEPTALAFAQLASIVSDIVTETYSGQTTTGNPASVTEANQVDALVQIVEDVITADDLTGLPTLVQPDTSWVTSGIITAVNNYKDPNSKNLITDDVIAQIDVDITNASAIVFPEPTGVVVTRANAKDQLIANRQFIVDDVIAFITQSYPTLDYDEKRCARDTGYIIDALIYDILYGSNSASRTVAESYYVGTIAQLGTDSNEITATQAAYVHLQDIATAVILGQTVSPTPGNTTSQDTSSGNASGVETDKLSSLVQIVIDVIDAGNLDNLPDIEYPSISWVSSATRTASTSIFAQRNNFATDLTTYILETFPDFTYDREKCKRDVGLIIDAVARDIRLNTNHNSIVAGLAYRRATARVVDEEQLPATLLALRYLGTLVEAIVENNTTLLARVQDRFDVLLTAIEFGTLPSEGTTYPSPAIASQALIDSARQLQDNRAFLIEETIAWINDNYFVYDAAKCARDSQLILDAVALDLVLGTNYNSVTAGLAYYNATASAVISDQKTETIAAITHLRSQVATLIASSASSVTRTNAAFNEIIDIIQNGVVSADALTWTDPGVDPNKADARVLLQTNRTFIINDVISYINTNYPSLVYDTAKCQRDTGYIIDALSHDVQYGTNFASKAAATLYFEGSVSVLPSGEKAATSAAFTHLADVAAQVVIENYPGQSTTGNPASSTEMDEIAGLVSIITDVIDADDLTSLPADVDPDLTWVNSQFVDSRNLILASGDSTSADLVQSVIDYINENLDGLSYNETACRRDTGYLVDAVTHDMLYGGNRSILISARAYFDDGMSTIIGQEVETAAALEHLRDVSSLVIEGTSVTPTTGNTETQVLTPGFGTSTQSTIAEGLYDIVITAISDSSGLATTPPNSNPSYSWLSADIRLGAEAVEAASTTMQQQVIDWITENIISFSYNVDKCARDTSYIIEAAVYDMMYGGNKQTRRAAEAYYNGAILGAALVGNADQIGVTEYTYKHLANVLSSVAQNIAITPSAGVTLVQNTAGTDGSTGAASYISTMVYKIADVVRYGNTSLPTEVDHNYDGLGDAGLNVKRELILDDLDDIEDAAISSLNLEYGGVAELTLFPGLLSVLEGTLGSMQNVSTVSTAGHAFEYVGAGITYNALPFFGGTPIAENEFVETNTGKVFVTSTDQIGNFRVGNFFNVNALTGAITLNANQINLQGLSSVGPFQRNGIPVGVQLQEVSNSTNLVASTGSADANTVPTQFAVVNYVENRYLNKLTGGTVNGNVTFDENITVDGGELSTISTEFDLIADNANVVNFATGATSITIGASIGTTTIRHDVVIDGTADITGDVTVIGDFSVTIPDEVQQAFNVSQGTEDYISIDTREALEKITFGPQPKVEIQNVTQSDSGTTDTGALVIAGGVGIGKNLSVGGDIYFEGTIISTSSSSLSLFNDVAGTVDLFGAATQIELGSAGIVPGNFIVNNDYIQFTSVYNMKIPTGATGERGITADAGYIRFNTDLGLFEGYDGVAWNSLGGVRDVDGNTYISPESAPGANENTLSFVTDGFERMSLSTTELLLDPTITKVWIEGTIQSTSPDNGQLIVSGGVGIAKNLNVRGDIRGYNNALFEGDLTATGSVTFGTIDSVVDSFTVNANSVFNVYDNTVQAFEVLEGANSYFKLTTTDGNELATFDIPRIIINNTTESTDFETGAVVIAGGLGVGGNLNVAGGLNISGSISFGDDVNNDTFSIVGDTDFTIPDNNAEAFRIDESTNNYFNISTTNGSELITFGTTPKIFVANTTDSNSKDTGALVVDGGVGIELNTYIGVDLFVGRNTELTGDLAVNGGDLTTTATTFNLIDTNATTVNFAGAATTINIGAATGTVTFSNNYFVFDSAEAIKIPVGSTGDRPTAEAGQIRFNSTTSVFEGYDGIAWGSLGGVKDVDQNTFIRPETSPGANNDELEFFTNGTLRATLGNTYFNIEDSVITTFANTTASSDFGTGAVVVAGGVGIGRELHVQEYIGGNNSGVLQLTNLASDKILIKADTIESPEQLRFITGADDSSGNEIIYPITLVNRSDGGTVVAGAGTGIKFELETSNDNFEIGGKIDIVAQDVTGTQEDFDMVFSTMISGSVVEKFRLSETVSTLTTDLAINNDTLSTNQTTFNLLNTTATTINFGGAATVIAIGATGGLTTFDQNVTVNEDLTVDGTLILTNTDLEVQYGGTGVSTFTTDGILYGNAADPVQVTAAAGTSDATTSFQILTVTSAVDATPVWTDTIDGGSF